MSLTNKNRLCLYQHLLVFYVSVILIYQAVKLTPKEYMRIQDSIIKREIGISQ
jgi:hypothetical protein